MQKIFNKLPHFVQNTLISIFNFLAYQKRYGGKYSIFINTFYKNRNSTIAELKAIQKNRYSSFLNYANTNSEFYKQFYQNIEGIEDIDNIKKLPIVNKELLRKNIASVYTINEKDGIVSKTGGTTGKSLTVLYTVENTQERFAMLDDFRGRFGYKLGKKTAWFSGKQLLTDKDVRKNRFWKTDYIHKVRYYSTFHIKESNLPYYITNLLDFKPEFIVGFPSTILEIAKYGLKQQINFPENIIKAIFPTAESVSSEMRTIIESFFKTKMYNQYASSEGAPFIFECINNKLHLELQSGVFEVLDEHDDPAQSGKLIVTAFATEGTPLIRYDIGDSIVLSDEICNCGNNNPIVKEILGRIDDYIYSPEMGKVNLGNISNTIKGTKGIIKFQVNQDELDAIKIKIMVDPEIYNEKIRNVFLDNWRDRIGRKMKVDLIYVDDIPHEASGKFRIVKNNIKHLI